ncbi:phospholipid:diacylglycerol acyltransferase [Marasmius crinis-equi]|uniref:Phospholipid:diacylglycerol acyltransferase n=1 Tax=Marasmius crinis-equi TaxID=585013 RepID=A0ABR3F0G6_9AGAR
MVVVQRAKTWAASEDSTEHDLTESTNSEQNEDDGGDKSEIKKAKKSLVAEVRKLKKEKQRPFLASRRFLFPLGMMLGVLLAFAFVAPGDIHDMHNHITLLLAELDFPMPEIPGFDLSRLEIEWNRLRSNIPEVWKFNRDGREFQVGEQMAERGLSAKYPVVLIPGVISTGLESWSTTPEYRPFFREKMWGGLSMLSQVTFNREKWIQAMMLDPATGLDPKGAKVRAAEGIDAASVFIQGYWIWSKIVENLAAVNYDTNNLHLAPYDWRLSYYNLEERDGYFSKLKSTIEGFNFKWVESPEHGAGGPDWVENHIEAYVSIAGTHLGVTKAMAAFLSGEMKDTVQMNPAGSYVLEKFFSRAERRKLFLSWAGTGSMWVKGGDAIWGNETFAPDDESEASHTHGQLIAFRQDQEISSQNLVENTRNMSAEDSGVWILAHTPSAFQKMMATNYSFGIERNEEALTRNDLDHTKWMNPLEVRLPRAPSMKMYCVYGHGKETERSYWYARGEYERDEQMSDSQDAECTDPDDMQCTSRRSPLDLPLLRKSYIDAEYTNETSNPKVRNGVRLGEGDGTVSLLSLGAMCVEGWKRPRWNPAGINITTVELPHRPIPSLPRGGANTSEHVDILGSTALNEIIVKVATGVGSEIEESYVSNIRTYSKRIRWD